MQKLISNFSIAKKLTCLTLSLCVSGALAVIFLVYFSIMNINEKILGDELLNYKSIIENVYPGPMWSFDKNQIDEVSNLLLKGNGFVSIVALRVSDSNGKIIFYKNNFSEAKSFEEYSQMPFTKNLSSEMRKNGEFLGRVDIAYTSKGVMANFRDKLGKIFLFSICVFGAIGVWVYFLFNKLITVPLNKFLHHISLIRNLNYEKQEYGALPDELMEISTALNFTSFYFKIRNSNVQDQTETLEKIIDEKSMELEAQILKNINASRLVAVGEVAAGIAHEINNPLTVILGQVQKMKKQIKGSEKELEYEVSLGKISLMGERIVKIVNGLKLISRDGKVDPMCHFSIPKVVEEIKLLTEMKILSMNVNFKVEIDPSIEIGYGREVQVAQVLVNLINNAVDAIVSLPDKWISVEIKDRSDLIEFKITDSGNGISAELKEKIMQPFFTTKGVGKGTGLGLSISKNIISEHGGQFLYNDQSANTQFVFTILKTKADSLAS